MWSEQCTSTLYTLEVALSAIVASQAPFWKVALFTFISKPLFLKHTHTHTHTHSLKSLGICDWETERAKTTMIVRTPPPKRPRSETMPPESPSAAGSDRRMVIYEDSPLAAPFHESPQQHSDHLLCTYQCRQMVRFHILLFLRWNLDQIFWSGFLLWLFLG